VLSADKKSCSGAVVTVKADRTADLSIGSMAATGLPAVAIHAGQMINGSVIDPVCFVAVRFQVRDSNTVMGQDVYVTGSRAELGNWTPSVATKLSGATWPIWTVSKNLQAGTSYEYKYIKHGVRPLAWESGANRALTVPACNSPAVTVPLSDFRP